MSEGEIHEVEVHRLNVSTTQRHFYLYFYVLLFKLQNDQKLINLEEK